ncbi:substrate-binding periplasmic protein [Litorilituus lipolyticus]|uniref:Transporter substrate-binding domain-containing protein n=1 Tax=Litorilituus lipolyticus TaxID=2491017 RepID=A0A502KYS4_9GAMM|nr:hypothetical protein [Litorilituus lipolyticus]TPH13387.1 hypothetical protein EPA86_14455 [Litorilituus lipolyticus]
MYYTLLAFIIILYSNVVHAKIVVGVTVWDGYTNADETGIYLELVKDIYQNEEIEFKFTSYTRMTKLFEQEDYDFVIGVAREDVPYGYFPHWYLDIDYPVKAFFLSQRQDIKHLSDFENKTLSLLHGYDFNKYINYQHKSYLVDSQEKGFRLLLNRRIDSFIDYEHNLTPEIRSRISSLEVLPTRPIYIAFKDNAKGHILAQTYDARMLELRNSGKLKQLYGADYQHADFENFKADRPTIVIKTDDANLHRAKGAENLHSLEAGLYRLILSQLTQFNIEFVKIDSHSSENLLTAQQCFANKIYTVTRAEKHYFSKPFALYTGARLFSMQPLKVHQEIELANFIAASNLNIGITPSLLYSAPLMKELEQLPAKNIVEASTDVFAQLKELKNGRFDVKLAYPADVNSHWQFIGDKMPYSYPIKGMPPFAIGHVMCHQDDINKRFILKLNRVLDTLYQSEAYYNLLRQAAIGTSDSEFEQYFRTGFNLPTQ